MDFLVRKSTSRLSCDEALLFFRGIRQMSRSFACRRDFEVPVSPKAPDLGFRKDSLLGLRCFACPLTGKLGFVMKSKRFAVDFLLRKYTPRLGWAKPVLSFARLGTLRLRFLLNGLVLARIQKICPSSPARTPAATRKNTPTTTT